MTSDEAVHTLQRLSVYTDAVHAAVGQGGIRNSTSPVSSGSMGIDHPAAVQFAMYHIVAALQLKRVSPMKN